MKTKNMEAYTKLKSQLFDYGAELIAVSKTHPADAIVDLYNLGQRSFGENKVQELLEKNNALPTDIQWHFIGHLQRNKVKSIVPFVHLIHSVDSLRLLLEIEKRASEVDININVLIQIHIAQESSKYGIPIDQALGFFADLEDHSFSHTTIRGLMGMATFTDDSDQVKKEFGSLKVLFDDVKEKYTEVYTSFDTLSMGMSGDYKIALEAGSNMIRVGSLLFGARDYGA